ncbi:MAG: hypothetical protein BRD50_00170 [Bacteroidetes bacterium SW_11_45_7]|nr:MAG: hypothetical protein BRD50_00170 [Bacteroidetes bacterium SW_11_45_7]
MIKYTTNTLKKLEQMLEETGMTVRYEKGSFASGYCILQDRHVVVVNKFYPLDARIDTLLEIIDEHGVDESKLSDQSRKLMAKIRKTKENN